MKKLLFLGFIFCFHTAIAQQQYRYKVNEVDELPIINKIECQIPASLECFTLQLNAHIATNFQYPAEALEKEITGKAYVQFLVDSLGMISKIQVRSMEKSFEEESIRIMKTLPQIVPAKKNGKPVAFSHSFPIVFNLKMEKEPVLERIPPIACEDAAVPPVFIGCRKSKNGKKCFEERLFELITKSKKLYLGDGEKFSGKVSVYFEINKDGIISNAIAVTTFPEAKKAVENYLTSKEVILEPAKNKEQLPIDSYFKTDFNLLAVGRTSNR
ncbi:energy transducer TonB [Flagellimonas sp. CMM7]|uniref:energy transducer TonB n=1 Tax=Flagellimonas sp. CMM7 TaxID=2654676 RepID=UPI0013D15BA7|nr:energy transducer TonB [Flagellimonas sp. CMM7]UII80780.1 energy transducer TonB [Flagellimonas sp. CMM7]